ncbi:MAG: DUF6111 family protein [Rhodospirillaceae bacterium]|nr:DUF6111 family protein [Rhodospirillaceae bacterium]
MIRILFTYVIPFLMPLAGYALWIWYRTWYAGKHGGEAPKFEQGPWPLMLFLGAVLALAMLGVTALQQGGSPDATYVPPRVENGKVVPGRMEEKQSDKPQ